MSSSEHIVRTVDATGIATAPYDSVSFTVQIETRGETGREAKDTARPIIDTVRKTIDKLRDEVKIDGDSDKIVTTFDVTSDRRYNNEAGGYEGTIYTASFTMIFRTQSVDKASLIHDELTSIDGVQVRSPRFIVKDISAMEKQAFLAAKIKAKMRFAYECKQFELEKDDFTITRWSVSYESDRSSKRNEAMTMRFPVVGSEGSSQVEIASGKARINAHISITFVKKASFS